MQPDSDKMTLATYRETHAAQGACKHAGVFVSMYRSFLEMSSWGG